MDLRLLNYFVILSEEMNYRKAAERLYITQPTLSQQIKQLEQNLSLTLFNRSGNQLILTPEGELLKIEAYRLFKNISELELALANCKEQVSKEIVIGVTGASLLVQPIVEFSKIFPNNKIQVHERSYTSLLPRVLNGSLDMGISYTPEFLDENLIFKKIGNDKCCCVVNQKHDLFTQQEISLIELLKYPLVLPHPNLAVRKYLKSYENKEHIYLDPLYEMPNYSSCLELVKQNLGVSLLPYSFIKNGFDKELKIIEVTDFDELIGVSLFYRRDKAFNTFEKSLTEMIANYLF
ncbi:LysR family transcriptional regulator [Enterococcus rivorum]|uniref:HTH lysR-type domain-containing protein n=1 Tax=Enterococcus rivorum TaxID=762845 RepID=A0A1E5KWI0_9ENTE|nr:LysR family transcriptional regulator [Enterococcus rivorum]MBP2099005.1 DNA-binding transcriptional LysR family regulator [Enterococcus rivorum]OEH81979.1 hypothetical protein BCR26_15150 [Enterococcus rivorum]